LPEVLTIPYPPNTINQLSTCEEIIQTMPNCPTIKFAKQAAYYDPLKDCINMPQLRTFASPESYYSTLFHEMVHSTGHQSRLNRKEIVEPSKFGSEMYGIEELTAEIGAAYLTSVAGIINKEFDNSVAYIKGWIDLLQKDKRVIVYASGQAQKATDYIFNVKSYPEKLETTEAEIEYKIQK
jgi:antirestriction protein ArdC